MRRLDRARTFVHVRERTPFEHDRRVERAGFFLRLKPSSRLSPRGHLKPWYASKRGGLRKDALMPRRVLAGSESLAWILERFSLVAGGVLAHSRAFSPKKTANVHARGVDDETPKSRRPKGFGPSSGGSERARQRSK